MQTINLKEQYGDRYRITYDPAAEHEPCGKRDPWYFVIPCKYGQIYPYSDHLLAVMVIGSKKAAEVGRIGLTLHQEADGEAVYLFSPEQFEEVARIVQAKKKKRLSAPHLQKLQNGATAYRKTG